MPSRKGALMSDILLVEPDYRSKFPPLGLMRISSYHKENNDAVTFVRGKNSDIQKKQWDRIYISSLFTYELPRTVETVNYYSASVSDTKNIFVGGIGATLLPSYVRENASCQVITGALDKAGLLGEGTPAIAHYVPDYEILKSVAYEYRPKDSYFFRITIGCIRKCAFCAVPKLEPTFGFSCSLQDQINEVVEKFGERQHLVLMDNNILAIDNFETVISDIRNAGFQSGAKMNGRRRDVDFNQGIDARLITPRLAKLLSSINLKPVRLAFDFLGMERQYRHAIELLSKEGLRHYTNYVMFNFNDNPESLYRRIQINLELSEKYNIQITSFPMRYVPIDDVNKRHISKGWTRRYLRGVQCLLNATHGIVSPNPTFVNGAFGKSFSQFLELLTMPDNYVIYRKQFKDNKAKEWREAFRRLSTNEKKEFVDILDKLYFLKNKKEEIKHYKAKYRHLLWHYYQTE